MENAFLQPRKRLAIRRVESSWLRGFACLRSTPDVPEWVPEPEAGGGGRAPPQSSISRLSDTCCLSRRHDNLITKNSRTAEMFRDVPFTFMMKLGQVLFSLRYFLICFSSRVGGREGVQRTPLLFTLQRRRPRTLRVQSNLFKDSQLWVQRQDPKAGRAAPSPCSQLAARWRTVREPEAEAQSWRSWGASSLILSCLQKKMGWGGGTR